MSQRPPNPLSPAPASRAFYLDKAETCIAAAAATKDATMRALHEDECKLWLILARQRQAIEAVLRTYMETTEAA
jgi:hypothetical protein